MEENGIVKAAVFRSHYEAAKKLPADQQLAFLRAMLDYQFEGKTEEDLPLAVDCLMTCILPVLDKEVEAKAGRPECDITAEEIAAKKEELGSADACANFYGISRRTVYNKLQSANCATKVQSAKSAKNTSANCATKVQSAKSAKTNEECRKKNEECRTENVERGNEEKWNEERENGEKREGEHSSPVAAEPPASLGSDTLSENSVLFPQEAIACTSQSQKSSRFIPPTIGEVAAYCKERGNGVDAESFVAFYASKGWFVGKNKMKDWRQAVITWEKRSKEQAQGQYSARASPAPAAVQREESGGWHTPHTVFPVIRTEEDYKAHEKRMEEYNRWADECLGLTKRDEGT